MVAEQQGSTGGITVKSIQLHELCLGSLSLLREYFWFGSFSLSGSGMVFCPGAHPGALSLSLSLWIHCGLLAFQRCHRSFSSFLSSLSFQRPPPWSPSLPKQLSFFSHFHVEPFFQTDTLLLTMPPSSFSPGQQSQGFAMSSDVPLPFPVYPADLFPPGAVWPCLLSSFSSSGPLVAHWIPTGKQRSPLSGVGDSEEGQLFLNLIQLLPWLWSEMYHLYPSASKTRELVWKRIYDFIPCIDYVFGLLEIIF